MSVSNVIGNYSNWRERQQARRDHERLSNSENDTEAQEIDTSAITASQSADSPASDVEDTAEESAPAESREVAQGNAAEDDDELNVQAVTRSRANRNRVTLAELEEEREQARRRTSACVLLVVFVLFRLWIEALMQADFGMLMLCLICTSWTARWVRHNREREEELDRRIQTYTERGEDVDRRDLEMLSFQAQLALAIMESQRNMMEGGFGHPDGAQGSTGVSDQAKQQWEVFEYKEDASVKKLKKKGSYGSVGTDDTDKLTVEDELPSCTICLGEYEEGEKLVKLPCGHVFHEECISSWTSNHTRCPLCNLDLEAAGDEDTASTSALTIV